eukprot:727214-Heterocapsa_arctica.AAC.1
MHSASVSASVGVRCGVAPLWLVGSTLEPSGRVYDRWCIAVEALQGSIASCEEAEGTCGEAWGCG